MSESESTPAGDESAAKSMLAESFRVVLASLMRETAGFNRPQVILVTSPGPEEGKTTIASNLGRALAETGRRVLVFDADFRRPRAHKVLGVPNTRGLVDLLAETTPMDDYSREDFGVRTAYPHLYVLPNGRRSENIAKALYSSRLRELVLRLRKEFDMVVIDAPPIQAVADARVMSDMTDGIVLVLRSGITDRQSAVDTLNQMRADGLVVLGTVLNDWTPSKSQLKKNYYYTSLNSYDRT
jgi:capsular exopolysaccharide synthesis family protein